MNIHTKTAIGAIKRSPFQAISAIFVLSLTFFVASMVAVLVYSSNKMLSYFETRPQIISFLKSDISSDTRVALEEKLKKDPRIKDIKYVDSQQALEIYKKATSDNPLLAELVSPSIFPASLEFSVVDLKLAEEVISEVKKEAIVEQVGFTANIGGEKTLTDVVTRLKTISYYLRLGGIVFFLTLATTSFLVLMFIIGMRMNMKKAEVEIISLIGGTRSFVSKPIIIESLIYSLIGVISGWFMALLFWLYLSPTLISYFGEIQIIPVNPYNFFLLFALILLIELVFGFLISLLGSTIAISRSLKKIK